jgi:hypothetical protein
MFHERKKDVDIRYHYIRGVIAKANIKVCKISTHGKPVDMMTESIPTSKFMICSSLIGVIV